MTVTYIGHSGFLLETEDAYFLFDYFEGTIPELKNNKSIIVFSSHRQHIMYIRINFNKFKNFRIKVIVMSVTGFPIVEKHIIVLENVRNMDMLGAK